MPGCGGCCGGINSLQVRNGRLAELPQVNDKGDLEVKLEYNICDCGEPEDQIIETFADRRQLQQSMYDKIIESAQQAINDNKEVEVLFYLENWENFTPNCSEHTAKVIIPEGFSGALVGFDGPGLCYNGEADGSINAEIKRRKKAEQEIDIYASTERIFN